MSGVQWRITRFYVHPKTHRRKESWNFLDALNCQFNLPWLCFGDFNEILSMKEKRVVPQGLKTVWRVFEEWLIDVGLKTWDTAERISPGATNRKGRTGSI